MGTGLTYCTKINKCLKMKNGNFKITITIRENVYDVDDDFEKLTPKAFSVKELIYCISLILSFALQIEMLN